MAKISSSTGWPGQRRIHGAEPLHEPQSQGAQQRHIYRPDAKSSAKHRKAKHQQCNVDHIVSMVADTGITAVSTTAIPVTPPKEKWFGNLNT